MHRGVLVTRPEPGAAETGTRLAALGWRPILAPALVLTARPFARPHAPFATAQALLLPSRAAARAVRPWAIPVIGVGAATAEAARAQGFADVQAAEGDASALAALCAATRNPADGPLLLAAGAGYSLELAAALRAHGFRVIRRVVYEATEAAALPEAARDALRDHDVSFALFFSPRSAACSLRVLQAAGFTDAFARIEAIAISPRVAGVLAGQGWKRVRAARRPDQDHMLEMLGPP